MNRSPSYAQSLTESLGHHITKKMKIANIFLPIVSTVAVASSVPLPEPEGHKLVERVSSHRYKLSRRRRRLDRTHHGQPLS